MSLITLPHAVFLYDENGNPVPITGSAAITSGSRGFIVYGKDELGQARNFSVDHDGRLAIQSPTYVDVFNQAVSVGRYNQIEIAYDQTDPDAISDITVTKTNGGDAVNSNGQAVFSTSTNANGAIKVVSNATCSYRPHAESYAAFTSIFTSGTINSFQRIGLYDDNNGFFIGYESASFGVTIRKGGVDTFIPRASFSQDTLTGQSGSGYTRNGTPEILNTERDNLYRIRFGWLGAAPITFEVLSPDGDWIVFHKYKHPNLTTGTTINNPDLPLRLEAKKVAGDATNITISTACWAAGTTSDLAKVSSTVSDTSLVKFVRSVLTAKQPSGAYINIGATTGGNLKVSVEEFDPAVLGQKTMANSLAVVIASNQSVIPVNDNSGSLTIDNANLDAALSTLATSANQTNGTQKTQIVSGSNILDVNSSGQAAIQNQPNMDVALSTRLSTAQFTSSIGEVSATPTANTVLGRLKDVKDEIVARLNVLGQNVMTGSTPVVIASDQTVIPVNDNSGSLTIDNQYIDANLSTLLTTAQFTSSLGNVTANPADYTVLARLKNIVDYLSASLNTLGQKAMTGSAPVVIASNQSEYPVIQGTATTASNAWPVKVTDGTNFLPTLDVQTRAGFVKLTDGTNNIVTVKTGSVSASINDNALVTALSPNTQLPSGSNILGGTRLYDYNDTKIRATAGQELRIAELFVLGEFNSRYTLESFHWDTLTASAGYVAHNANKAAIEVTASTASGSTATLRTNTYFKYQCGFSQLCGMTLLHTNTGSANQVREWGYYDDKNGYFFRLNGTALSIVKRSNVSGTPVEVEYAQAAWTNDPFNGTGKSGVNLDVSKGNAYEIEAQCFGVGVIRFFINGTLVHQLNFTNSATDPAMQTISLPVQVNVYNTGTSTAGGITFLTSRVVAEGLTHDPLSRVYGVTNPTDLEVGLTERPILSIRPKATFNGIDNRSWLLPVFAQISTQGYKVSYKIILNAKLTGASWTSVGTESTAEYDTSATSYTDGEVIYSHFIPLDDDTDDADLESFFGAFGRKLRNAGFLGAGSNTVDSITIVAKNEAVGKSEVRASMSWKEVRV